MSMKLYDFHNFAVVKFGVGIVHSFLDRIMAMIKFIKNILHPCSPTQVIKSAMGSVSILVATFMSGRWGTNKGKQDQSVNCDSGSLSVLGQIYKRITGTPLWFKNLLWHICNTPFTTLTFPVRSYPALVTYLISRKSWNRQPSLLNLIGDCVKLLVSHGVALLHRVTSGLGPGQRVVRYPARFFMPQLMKDVN